MTLTTVSNYSESRAFVFVDGMNLFNNAKRAFGYSYPNYDVAKLARAVCSRVGCELVEARFCTGVPPINDWRYHFWFGKTESMRQSGVTVYTRRVRTTPEGASQEKGIDLRIGLDALALAFEREYDVLVLFSTDQDFTELGRWIRRVSDQQNRNIKMVSAFPADSDRIHGIKGMSHFRITREFYDACIDPRDYRPRRKRN